MCRTAPSDLLDQTVMVNPGDKVVVPKAGIVYVLGDVGRPGGYPMTNNDGTLTVLQAIAAAGGTASVGCAQSHSIDSAHGGGGLSKRSRSLQRHAKREEARYAAPGG